jgi:hypothetical protein
MQMVLPLLTATAQQLLLLLVAAAPVQVPMRHRLMWALTAMQQQQQGVKQLCMTLQTRMPSSSGCKAIHPTSSCSC